MSKRETPLTLRYWQSCGGIFIPEFRVVERSGDHGQRLIDGLIVLGEETRVAHWREVDLAGRDIVSIQTKANRLGMYLLGQAYFSRELSKAVQSEEHQDGRSMYEE